MAFLIDYFYFSNLNKESSKIQINYAKTNQEDCCLLEGEADERLPHILKAFDDMTKTHSFCK